MPPATAGYAATTLIVQAMQYLSLSQPNSPPGCAVRGHVDLTAFGKGVEGLADPLLVGAAKRDAPVVADGGRVGGVSHRTDGVRHHL
jgi:hypothetical protein